MPDMTAEDFPEVTTRETLDDVMRTGYAPSGQPGTPEHAEAVADALAFADGDIYYDYADGTSTPGEFAAAAATAANIASLQSAVAYAREVFAALAADPDLLTQVQHAVSAGRGAGMRR